MTELLKIEAAYRVYTDAMAQEAVDEAEKQGGYVVPLRRVK
jgi:hypothetical protein